MGLDLRSCKRIEAGLLFEPDELQCGGCFPVLINNNEVIQNRWFTLLLFVCLLLYKYKRDSEQQDQPYRHKPPEFQKGKCTAKKG
ncbi:hypothetical protein BRADI_1g59795v3 [Brachypodium distachyon]|uniref:Uncharacterized protein n=1 Tax=Brachypodium distachyon TaxID=15368 RepID=A0A0Q3HEG1_BRADI|nr:hypothetical protein BRADI_1g59795v3 [Brachypodium distachyon]